MHERILLVSAIARGLAVAGCQSRATEMASSGAPPAVKSQLAPYRARESRRRRPPILTRETMSLSRRAASYS